MSFIRVCDRGYIHQVIREKNSQRHRDLFLPSAFSSGECLIIESCFGYFYLVFKRFHTHCSSNMFLYAYLVFMY